MFKYDFDPNVALNITRQTRPQCMLRSNQWNDVHQYRLYLDSQKQSEFNHNLFHDSTDFIVL